jgi:hypothetical protein
MGAVNKHLAEIGEILGFRLRRVSRGLAIDCVGGGKLTRRKHSFRWGALHDNINAHRAGDTASNQRREPRPGSPLRR